MKKTDMNSPKSYIFVLLFLILNACSPAEVPPMEQPISLAPTDTRPKPTDTNPNPTDTSLAATATQPLPTDTAPLPTQTNEPTSTPTTPPTEFAVSWPDEVFELGAGGGPLCGSYEGWPLPHFDIPGGGVRYLMADTTMGPPRSLHLCLWGEVPLDQDIDLVLHSPDGGLTLSGTFFVNSYDRSVVWFTSPAVNAGRMDTAFEGEPPSLWIPLWWPLDMPAGLWSVEAISQDFYASGTIVIDEHPGQEVAIIGQGEQNGEIQLNSSTGAFIIHHCHVLTYSRSGIPVEVRGVNFPRNAQVSLAFYRLEELNLILAGTTLVQADGNGIFQEEFTFPDYGDATSYALFAVWDATSEFFNTGIYPSDIIYEMKGAVDCFIVLSRP